MPKIRIINVENLKSFNSSRSRNIMETSFAEANLMKYSHAISKNPYGSIFTEHKGKKTLDIYESIRKNDLNLPEEYRKYDEKGRLTQMGTHVRQCLLERLGLGKDAKILDFFAFENLRVSTKEKESLFNKAIKLIEK